MVSVGQFFRPFGSNIGESVLQQHSITNQRSITGLSAKTVVCIISIILIIIAQHIYIYPTSSCWLVWDFQCFPGRAGFSPWKPSAAFFGSRLSESQGSGSNSEKMYHKYDRLKGRLHCFPELPSHPTTKPQRVDLRDRLFRRSKPRGPNCSTSMLSRSVINKCNKL